MIQSSAVYGLYPRRWLIWLAPVCLLLGSCVTPAVSPAPNGAAHPSSDTAPTSAETEHRAILQPNVDGEAEADKDTEINNNPEQRRERLERRLQMVITCLEEARKSVMAAEVAGAGIETVSPAIHALHRSEAALREAQAQLLRGDMARVDAPLDTAEAECHAAYAFSQQI